MQPKMCALFAENACMSVIKTSTFIGISSVRLAVSRLSRPHRWTILNSNVEAKSKSTTICYPFYSKRCLSTTCMNEKGPRSELEQRLCPLKFGSSIDPVISQLPDTAKIVIVGGGAQGMAIAYKLALKGYGPDTVILDQGQMGGGSTWNSAGIVSLLAKSSVEMKLSR